MRAGAQRFPGICAVPGTARNNKYFLNPDALLAGIENINKAEKEILAGMTAQQ